MNIDLRLRLQILRSDMTLHVDLDKKVWTGLCISGVEELSYNDSQLAKLKKSIRVTLLPWNLEGRSSWSKKFQLYFNNTILVNMWNLGQFLEKSIILQITASLKFESENYFANMLLLLIVVYIFCTSRILVNYRFSFPILLFSAKPPSPFLHKSINFFFTLI